MRQMPEVFLDGLNPSVGVGVNGVSLSVDERTELDDELFKPQKVKFLGLSLVQLLDVDVPDQVSDLVFVGEEK
jgi:hypothetical protein